MEDHYLGKKEVAALFDSSAKAAEEQLAKAGVRPINLGPGRRRGKRWLESAVRQALQSLYEKAQPKPPKPRKSKVGIDWGTTTCTDLAAKLDTRPFTSSSPIQ